MKFIKIENTILNEAELKSIYINGPILIIKTNDGIHRFYFPNERVAKEELSRIYKQLEKL